MSFLTGSVLVDILLGLVSVCCLFYWYITSNDDYWEKRGVPHTKSGFMKETIRGRKPMADVINDLYKRFSDKRFFGFFQINQPMLVINDLDLLNKILIKDFTHFQDRGNPQNDKELLSKNLFNLKGQVWRMMRYKLTPTFTTGKLKNMFEQVSLCGANMIDKIDDLSGKDPDVDCKDFLFEFTTEVISSCAFGLQFEANSKEFNTFKTIVQKMFRPSFLTILKFFVIMLFPKLAQRLNLTVFINKTASDYFLNLIKSTINYRKENNIQRNDYLQMLLALKEQEDNNLNMGLLATDTSEDDAVITDQLKYTELNEQPPATNMKSGKLTGFKKNLVNEVTSTSQKIIYPVFTDETVAANSVIFLVAGSESTSNTTALILYQLARHPGIQRNLQQEVDSVLAVYGGWSYQALKEMTYLDQVIQETQRFYPLLPLLQRECTKSYRVPDSDLVIEKGVLVSVPVIGLQMDPQYYPEPDAFKPERFEGNNFKPSPTYLPFGDGPRICIAMRFAVMEMKTAVSRIVANYTVTLSPKTQLPLKMSGRSFFPVPEHGIWLNLEKRVK